MKKSLLCCLLASVFALSGADISVPVIWSRNKVRNYQVRQAGFAEKDGKYIIAVEIENLQAMMNSKGAFSVYWNFDGNKNTGRFPGKQGIDLQINVPFGRKIALIRWDDAKKQRTLKYSPEMLVNGNTLTLFVAKDQVAEFNFAKNSEVWINLNLSSKRTDYIGFFTNGAAKAGKSITVKCGKTGAASAAADGEIAAPMIWKSRKAVQYKISQAGFYEDSEKYIFAFKIGGLAEIIKDKASGGIYWNCDGDRMTGRFPRSQGVDVQFNINFKDRRINVVRWNDAKDHRTMTIYEDDYLVEAVDDVLYIGLRKQALNQFKIAPKTTFLFQYSWKGKMYDRVFFRTGEKSSGKEVVLPGLKFVRFGALKSIRNKTSFATPVARRDARALVWDCGGERFSVDEATPKLSAAIPALKLGAARGETASIFFAVEQKEKFSSLEIVPGKLTGKGGKFIAPEAQKIQYADYISDDRGSLFTDILFDRFPGRAVKRQFAVLHLDVPRNAAAGKYRGELRLTVDGKADKAIPVEVDIYNFELPVVPAMRSAFSIKNSHVVSRFPNREVSGKIYKTMLERGAKFRFGPRLPGIEPQFRLDEKGKLHIFWDDFDRQVKYLINTLGVNTIQLPPGQLGSHDRFVRWNTILKKKYKNTDDPEFQSVFKQYVRAYKEHIWKLGIEDKMLFIVWDEPYGLEEPIKGAKIVRETEPEIPIGIFIDRYDEEINPYVDIWLTTLQNVAKVLQQSKGKRVWLYNSNGVNNFKLPAADLRSFFYLADRCGIEGFLSSEFNVISKSGVKDGIYYNHYPQHLLFYVSDDGSEVYDSWRLVLLRQGFNDYDYLAIYKKLLKSKGKSVPKWLIDAEPTFGSDGLPDFKINTMKELDALKNRIAREIEKLQ